MRAPGTPDIQEILVCANGSRTIEDAVETNLRVHRELGRGPRRCRPRIHQRQGVTREAGLLEWTTSKPSRRRQRQ